jgi:Tol biopolymer transport system component
VDEGTGTQPGGTPTPTTEMSGRFFLDLRTGVATPLPEGIPAGTIYAPSPDGTMLATNPCCSSSDPVWISNIDGTGARTLTPDDVDGYGARWSPNGSMLVYQGRDGATQELGNLFVVGVTSGATTQITNLEPASHGWWFMAPSFSPDGRRIIFHMPRGRGADTRWDIWTVPVAGGEPTLMVPDASTGVYGPDGEQLSYLDSPRGVWSSSRLMVADAAGSAPKVLVQGDEIAFPRWSPSGTSIAYADGDEIFVVDVSSGVSTKVADGGWVEWLDDDTLVISPS